MSSYYIELVFFGTDCGIVRKISLTDWRINGSPNVILSDGRVVFLYDKLEIKHFWKTFRKQTESYDPPFDIVKLQICLKRYE